MGNLKNSMGQDCLLSWEKIQQNTSYKSCVPIVKGPSLGRGTMLVAQDLQQLMSRSRAASPVGALVAWQDQELPKHSGA